MHISIDQTELIRELSMWPGDALDFVKRLDEQIGTWDFTLALADHFDALRKKQAEDEAARRARAHK